MPTVNELIRRRLLKDVPEKLPEIDRLKVSERSPEFERLRMNRKIIGAFRYGLLGGAEKPEYDRVKCMMRRLKQYVADGNAEHLVDVANLAELEFVEGNHRGVHPQDDGEHTPEK